ncbi:MAG TPA: arginyltransferase [Alphaproteobacteria bacterium]|nr:arginyltransferase [Alphaproteobacteria bacterium]
MSIIKPDGLGLHHFFRSGPMPCPYIPGRIERKLFTRLTGPNGAELNSLLSRAGFRRSHDIIYRPVCPSCRACVPVRIPVALFAPSRSMRRTAAENADVTVAERCARATEEDFRLFLDYQRARHGDSDMARMTEADFMTMIEEGNAATSLFEFRDGHGRLVGVMLTDRLEDGFSAVYSYFEPNQPRRGMGTFMILSLVRQAKLEGLPFVYLGYWIAESRKMAYKRRFRPMEALTETGWRVVDLPAKDLDGDFPQGRNAVSLLSSSSTV